MSETRDTQLRPMLAAKFDEARTEAHLKEDGHLLVQPKIDGMRVLHYNGEPKSRSWKTWTSAQMNYWAAGHRETLHGLDGELLPGLLHEQGPDSFRRAMSDIRAEVGGTEFTYYVFDNFLEPAIAYESRLERIVQRLGPHGMMIGPQGYKVQTVICPTIGVHSLDEIYQHEEKWLALGFEGVIIRRRLAPYKYNRATAREGWLTKLKRFEDAEAEIIGVEPRYKNNNEQKTNELGYSQRSAHQGNLEEQSAVGAFRVRLVGDRTSVDGPPVEFNIGVFLGFGISDREALWIRRDELLGKVIKFKHQGYGGGYDAPRTPVMLGFRDPIEL